MTVEAGRAPAPWGAAARFLVLLLAAATLVSGLSWSFHEHTQQRWTGTVELPVVLAGEHYRISPTQLRWLEEFSALHFSAGEHEARVLVGAEVDARLAQLFDGVTVRLDAFADWYYSPRGEYSRLGMAMLSAVNLSDGEYVAARAAATLFPEGLWDDALTTLDGAAMERLQAHGAAVHATWLQALTERLAAHRVPAPVAIAHDEPDATVQLDRLLQRTWAREQSAFEARVAVSSVAAGGVAAGPAVWRAANARRAAAGGRAALARGAGRGAARAGSAAMGGAAACAPTGPLAVGCALAAGAVAWIATDWALLKLDEALNRDALVTAFETSLGELEAAMRADLMAAYDALIAAHYDAMQQDIRRGFVPAAAGMGT
jgi:hypothetical protein